MIALDDVYMEQALKLSRRGLGRVAPNPNVGAVLVQYGDVVEIVGRGWTQPGGRPHAETEAIKRAGSRAKGGTLYVTLEPCSHFGKTPPCAQAIIDAKIERVVCAANDPDDRVSGRGFQMLRDAGIVVDQASPELVARAEWIMRGYLLCKTKGRPFVQVKLAVDADYQVSQGDGEPVWISGPESRAQAHLLRAQADAILIGRGTAMADNPSLTCRLPGLENRSPVRVLLDKGLQTPVTHELFRSAGDTPLWVFCGFEIDQGRLAEIEQTGAKVFPISVEDGGVLDIDAILKVLAEQGVTRLMVEGGPTVAGAFLSRKRIDELVLFRSDKRLSELGVQGKNGIEGCNLPELLASDKVQDDVKRMVGRDVMASYRLQLGY